LAANTAAAPAPELSLKARAQDFRRAGKTGSGVGRERDETWLKRASEQDGAGEVEKAAITGQKRDGVRTLGGAARMRDRDVLEVAGRRERRAGRKMGWRRRPSLVRSA
jgi:hypothetical protein